MNKIEVIRNELLDMMRIKKAELYENCIKERLDQSLQLYYDSLTKSLDNLDDYNERHNLRLAKRLNKED